MTVLADTGHALVSSNLWAADPWAGDLQPLTTSACSRSRARVAASISRWTRFTCVEDRGFT